MSLKHTAEGYKRSTEKLTYLAYTGPTIMDFSVRDFLRSDRLKYSIKLSEITLCER